MKYLAISVFLLHLFSCGSSTNQKLSLKGFEALEGTWIAKQGNVQFTETWLVKGERLTGKGYLIKDKDTTFGENLIAEMVNQKLVYIADVGDQNPTLFTCKKNSSTQWIFENPEHDFPNKITYTLNGTKLDVVLEGQMEDGKVFQESLNFVKEKP